MDNIEKIFKDKAEDVSFIEVKEGSNIAIKDYSLEVSLPLPVVTDNFIKEIQAGNASEGIDLGQVIDGIIYILGTDEDFPHVDKYIEILMTYNPKAEDYIIYRAMKSLEAEEFIMSGINLRAAILLNSNNLAARFNYALVLESIAKQYIEEEKLELGNEILIKSSNELETILEIDDSHSLAYYKLGYHYRYFEQYIKAQLTWKKYLQFSKDNNLLQEIREQLSLIDDNANFEGAISYYSYNDFGKALDLFFKILRNRKDDWNIYYLIGLCYKGMEEYDMAMEYLELALGLNDKEPDIFNELGIICFIQGKILEAIAIFNKGIEANEDDYKLLFNRGLGYVQLGEYKKALEDINKASSLNPSDENIKAQKKELENYLNSL